MSTLLWVILLLLSAVYLFSYAPVVRMQGSWIVHPAVNRFGNSTTVKEPIDGDNLPIYKPVDWLLDNTPFQDPLLRWAERWGVLSPFSEAVSWRQAGTSVP